MHAFIIGDLDIVTAFRLVGIKGAVVSSVDEAWHALSRAVENIDVAIIIISEEFSTKMRDKIDGLRLSRIAPLIVEIPGKLGRSEVVNMSDPLSDATDARE
jgi:V/A-type H+/Na+-transporting ATPase subunit F